MLLCIDNNVNSLEGDEFVTMMLCYFVAVKEHEELLRKKTSSVSRETDSGIEDTAGYREPTLISLRESEFHTNGDDSNGSEMEGSVVDTDYADQLTTKNANGDVEDVKRCREAGSESEAQQRVDSDSIDNEDGTTSHRTQTQT